MLQEARDEVPGESLGARKLIALIIGAMDNKQIAHILRETAQLLEIDGASIGRYRSLGVALLSRVAERCVSGPKSSRSKASRNARPSSGVQPLVGTRRD